MQNNTSITRLVVGQMAANCYLVCCKKTLKTLIIDPGDEADFITSTILDNKLSPLAIIATHGHFDHIMAAWELQQNFKIPFWLNTRDKFLVEKVDFLARRALGDKTRIIPPKIDKNLKQDDLIKFGEQKLKVLETPGHTPGGICLYNKENKILFSGDTLFKNGIGRYDFYYSRKEHLQKSLKKLLSFPPETLVYPGHGEKTMIKKEINRCHI